MNYQIIETLLPYIYIIALAFSVYALYSYLWYMYKNDKNGITDYENLANLAIDDNLNSKTINTSRKKGI